ncbi:prepilin-type N-terminal cleavage/methylation domain-containing protein [Methylobacter sp. G7]|uniref:type II secretion system protein n=1 Tax=Methylobacter sp. G7 TaxID=3230117 RepID=UPI003D800F21
MSKRFLSSQHGYSLVEISIVLAVMGLLVGSVSVGKDVIQQAEHYKLTEKFVMPWKQAYDQYYQRTGVMLGDNQVAPTYMVAGAEAYLSYDDGSVAGIPQNYLQTGRRICHGQGYPQGSVGIGDRTLANQDLHWLLDRVGIRMPPGRAEDKEDRYVYEDSNGNPAEMQICFQWNPDRTVSGSGNVMVLRGLTPDMARMLDQFVDGKPDALEGRFRQQNNDNNDREQSRQRPGHEWLANNTYAMGNQVPTAFSLGESQDENRVILLTAHWIMDQ